MRPALSDYQHLASGKVREIYRVDDEHLLFVASGIHGAETIGPDGVDAAAVETLLAKDGARATYAISDLAW